MTTPVLQAVLGLPADGGPDLATGTVPVMHTSLRTAAPALLAAVLLAAGSGAATWAFAGDERATRSGNEAPLDDNHGAASPSRAPAVTAVVDDRTAPDTVPAPAPTRTRTAAPVAPAAAPSPDDHGTDDHGTDDGAAHDAGDDHGGDRDRSGSSGHGSDDGSCHRCAILTR